MGATRRFNGILVDWSGYGEVKRYFCMKFLMWWLEFRFGSFLCACFVVFISKITDFNPSPSTEIN